MARSRKDVNVNIKTKADTSGLDKTAKALDKVEKEAKQAESRTERLARKFDQLGQSIPGSGPVSGFFRSLTSGAGKATIAIGAATAAVTGLFALLKQGVGRVSITEDLEASFTTLLGSAEAAKARIREVTEFASETPLSIAGLATASRVLETLSNGALGAQESLRLVGDAAAVAQRPGESLDQTIQNVALHVGRLNSALTTGKGQIGESTLRLQELGLIGVDTAYKLRELHQEGTKGAEAWGLLEDSLKKFSGEMERRSKTISGRVSTLKDAWNGFAAAVAKPVAPLLKSSVAGFTVILNGLAKGITSVLEVLRIVPRDASAAAEGVQQAAEKVKDATVDLEKAAEAGANTAAASIDGLAARYDELAESIQKSAKRAGELRDLQLRLEIQRIEQDESLSPLEKERRKGAAREAAGQESSAALIDGLDKQAQLLQQAVEELTNKALERSRAENELSTRVAELRDRIASAEREQSIGARLEEVIARLKPDVDLANSLQAQLIGGGGTMERRLQIKEQLAGIEDLPRKRQQLNALLRQRQSLSDGPSDNLKGALNDALLELERVRAEALTAREALEGVRAKNLAEIADLEAEIAHQRAKAELQARFSRGETIGAVAREKRNLEKADFTDKAKAAEPIGGDLLNAGGAAAQASARAAQGAEQLTQAAENIVRAAEGNVQATNRLTSLVGRLNGQVRAIEGEVKTLEAQIKNNRR